MNLADIAPAIQAVIKELNDTRERDALFVTMNGIALVTNRVTNTGINAKGTSFSAYSKNPLPLFFFGSSYGKDGVAPLKFDVPKRRKELYKLKGKLASYFDWRALAGRPTDKKDFSFDNQMWASIRAFVKSKTRESVDVEIKSSIAKYNNVIIPRHSNAEGINILQMNDQERELVLRAFANSRLELLRKHGLIK